MTTSIIASHAITIDLPVQQCQMLFTPAGEELWVEGWEPRYLHPHDGATAQGMVFATGSGEETTVWFMTEFSREPYRARYARVTPASRWGFVDVECKPASAASTQVLVTYELQALSSSGETALKDFEPAPFAAMIDDWKRLIDQKLGVLRHATIR
jgi:hypothetical protein